VTPWLTRPPSTEIPDSVSLDEFMLTEKHGRVPFAQSKNPFICGLTGKTYAIDEIRQRVTHLARAIAKRLDFAPNEGTEWDKVVALFSLNTVSSRLLPLAYKYRRG
jgi:hypothetical protein